VRSLLSATDSAAIEEDLERDYNKLARHPKGDFRPYISIRDEPQPRYARLWLAARWPIPACGQAPMGHVGGNAEVAGLRAFNI